MLKKIVFTLLLSTIIFSVLAINIRINQKMNPNIYFDDFEITNLIPLGCNCHTQGGSIVQGSGEVIMVFNNNVQSNAVVQINISVKNFIEAKLHSITFGFDKDETDNKYFTSITYFTTVTLDTNGNSLSFENLTINLIAPIDPGNYALRGKAIDVEGPSYTNKSDIYFLFTDYSIKVISNTTFKVNYNEINFHVANYEINLNTNNKRIHKF